MPFETRGKAFPQGRWFLARLDVYYLNKDFYAARPYELSIGDGQDFTRPIVAVIKLWEMLNASPAPTGVTRGPDA